MTHNSRAVYDQLLDHESLTRDELAELTGLTRVAASASVETLVARGLVVPVVSPTNVGPAAKRYALTATAGYVVGAYIRHGFIALAAADLTGRIAFRLETPFEDPDDAPSLLHSAITSCMQQAGADLSKLRRVVLGSPGIVDPLTGDFAFAFMLPTWKHTLTGDLRRRLGRPVVFENDVNLAAMAEARFGHGQGVRHLVFAWIDEGLGLGLVLNGRLYRGRHGWAGEVGYLAAPTPAPATVVVGMPGSIHQLASAPAISAFGDECGFGADPAVAVTVALHAGAAGAAFLDEVARRVSLVVSCAALLVDPSVLVIDGGYIAAGGDVLLGLIREHVSRTSKTPVRLELPTVHDEPILRGALQTALDDARDSLFAG